MDAADLIRRLETQGRTLADWLRSVPADELTWKPTQERWSMLEVLGHLCDEERDDFRARIRMTLERAGPWPPIDPEGWVGEHGYQDRDPVEALAEFERERADSITWLKGLGAVDWSLGYEHPYLGHFAAGDLLAAWTAHDMLHMKQLTGLRVDWIRRAAEPYAIRYAAP